MTLRNTNQFLLGSELLFGNPNHISCIVGGLGNGKWSLYLSIIQPIVYNPRMKDLKTLSLLEMKVNHKESFV